jgi:hypothetical protein
VILKFNIGLIAAACFASEIVLVKTASKMKIDGD